MTRIGMVVMAFVVSALRTASAQTPPAPPWRAHLVLPRSDAFCVHRDQRGFAWLCTDVGLLRLDGVDIVPFGWDAGLTWSTRARSIIGRSVDTLWVGGEFGLLEFTLDRRPARSQRYRFPLAGAWTWGTVHTLVQRADASVWCGTDKGLVRVTGTRASTVPLRSTFAQPAVHSIVEDDRHDLWIGASDGLYLYARDGQHARFTRDEGLPGTGVRAVAIDDRGRLWAGTDSGLAVVDRDKLRRRGAGAIVVYTSRHGLPATSIRDLRPHGSRVWIATTNGVAELLGATRDTLDLGFQARGSEVHRVVVDDLGDVWIAGEDGVRLLTTDLRSPSPAIITSVRVDDVPVPVRADGENFVDVRVPWTAGVVEINFVSPFVRTRIDPRSHAAFTYQVRSAPVNEDPNDPLIDHYLTVGADGWSYGGPETQAGAVTGAAAYAVASAKGLAAAAGWFTLPPDAATVAVIREPYASVRAGRHRLAVRMRERLSYVDLTIVAPPWVRWWFVGPLVLFTGAIVFVRRHARARHQRDLATLRVQIASDLHDSVGARMSRIALFTDVARQNSKAQAPMVTYSLDVIGDDARALVDEMNDAIWFIDDHAAALRDVIVRVRIAATALFEHDRAQWNIDADAAAGDITVTAAQRRNLFLFIKEGLTNARKHARASTVSVRMATGDHTLTIDIEDDGIGLSNSSRNAAAGNGMRNMQRRAAGLGATLTIRSRPEYDGTHITLRAPIPS